MREGLPERTGRNVQGSERLSRGDRVKLPESFRRDLRPPRVVSSDHPQDWELFRDEHFLAISKPSGMPCQGVRDAVDMRLPGDRLVHRLDRDTSGVLLLGRSRDATVQLHRLWRDGHVTKTYWVTLWESHPRLLSWAILVHVEKVKEKRDDELLCNLKGSYACHCNRYQLSIADFSLETNGKWRKLATVTVDCFSHAEFTKDSETGYRFLSEVGPMGSVVALFPHTGRQHQLRGIPSIVFFDTQVVCSDLLQTPILGDPKYGESSAFETLLGPNIPMHLHARRISFRHPFTGRQVTIEAPLPPHFVATLQSFGYSNFDQWDDSPV